MRSSGQFGEFLFDLFTSAEARVKKVSALEGINGLSVGGATRLLAKHLRFPSDSQPFKILEDRCFECLFAASGVNVFDPEEKASLLLSRSLKGGESGEGMAEVKETARTGSEASDEFLLQGSTI